MTYIEKLGILLDQVSKNVTEDLGIQFMTEDYKKYKIGITCEVDDSYVKIILTETRTKKANKDTGKIDTVDPIILEKNLPIETLINSILFGATSSFRNKAEARLVGDVEFKQALEKLNEF